MRCARVYPCSAGRCRPWCRLLGTASYHRTLDARPGCTPKTIVVDFNFQLGTDWRSTKTDFSLPRAFPKIHSKLARRSGVCWWFSIDKGRMIAFKGKAKKGPVRCA